MIFTLFLGGYLLPKTNFRISDQREYLIYQALCRNHSLDVVDTNISMLCNTLSMSNNQGEFDSKLKNINNLLQRKQILKAHDFFGLRDLDTQKSSAISNGLTGDISIDKLLRLHKLLSKYDIIK